MKPLRTIFYTTVLAIIAVSCANEAKIDIPEDCTGIEWHYEGHSGPSDWQYLCVGYAECGGKTQSPINISNPSTSSGSANLTLNYTSSTTDIVNNGHTIQFNYNPGSSMQWRGESWELLQFHMHTASEHTVNGASYPMEAHFVHKNQAGELAVIGILFEAGQASAFFSPFMSSLPTTKGQTVKTSATYTVKDVFPASLGHYQYDGSLTTPPCSKGVNWIVLRETMTASATQLTQFKAIMKQNNRPVQALNGRQVKRFD
jgi:carbonic anhydrase